MKKFLLFFLKVVKWSLFLLAFFVASLFFRDQRIPAKWVVAAVDARLPDEIVFSCEDVAFGFRQGLRMRGVRIYDRTRANPVEAALSFESATIDFILRRVRIVALKVTRLPDSYYLPGNVERNARVEVELPRIPSFALVLVRPEILGVAPERVHATVKVDRHRLEIPEFHLDWPDIDRRMALDGQGYADFDRQRVWGQARGEARQAHIRPMLVALDVPSALPYMDAFTGVTEPVRAGVAWDVNLVNNDFKLDLDLHPILGRYNGVSMRQADGSISLDICTRGTNLNYVTRVGPLVAFDPKGRTLEGELVVRGTNNIVNLDFNAKSNLEFAGLLSIIDYLNDGALDCLRCDTPPEVTVKGTLATEESRQAENDLSGTVAVRKGALFDMPLVDASCDYAYRGDTVTFSNGRTRGRDGGLYTGRAALRLPALEPEAATFSLAVDCRDGTLAELADALGGDFGGRDGSVNGSIELTGPISTNVYPRLNGKGRIRVTGECLAQMRFFMGLTDYLAKNVPGVAGLVNQSLVTADYTITNGVLRSENIFIEGEVISIKAWGSYDIAADALDFTVRVQLLRNDSFLSKLVRPVTFPFTKLLLEFHVTGPVGEPAWEYISVLDRIL